MLTKLIFTVEVSIDMTEAGVNTCIESILEAKQTSEACTLGVERASAKLHGDVPVDTLMHVALGETISTIIYDSITRHHAPPPELGSIVKCVVQYEETPAKLAAPSGAVPVVIQVGAAQITPSRACSSAIQFN